MKLSVVVASLVLSASCGGALAQDAALVVRELAALGPTPSSPNGTMAGWEIKDISDDGSTIIGSVWSVAPATQVFTESGFVWRPDDGTFVVTYENDPSGLPAAANIFGARLASTTYKPTPPQSFTMLIKDRATGQTIINQSITGALIDHSEYTVKALDGAGTRMLVNRDYFLNDASFFEEVRLADGTNFNALGYTKPGWTSPFTRFRAWDASDDLKNVLVQVVQGAPIDPRADELGSGYGVLRNATSSSPQWTPLKPIPKGLPHAISLDGDTVVGWVQNEQGGHPRQPVLWYKSNSATKLALPAGAFGGLLYDTSANGEVAVGSYKHKKLGVSRPMVWIKARGTRDLGVVLDTKFGVKPPANVALRSAWKVSGDGSQIAGFATGIGANAGKIYAYRATLPQSEICYCNCDGSTGPGYLNGADILCFQQRLAAKHYYANADNSVDASGKVTFDAADLQNFMDRMKGGCPE